MRGQHDNNIIHDKFVLLIVVCHDIHINIITDDIDCDCFEKIINLVGVQVYNTRSSVQ